MPNESWNKLVVHGPPKHVRRFREAVRVSSPKRQATALSLDHLRPRTDKERETIARRLGDLDWDPKWDAWGVDVGRIRTQEGIATLVYSFMTAWCEPIGPVACASMRFPELCFVLAGVETSNGDFTSSLIRRGRARHWTMPESVIEKVADFEEYEGEEGPFLAGYQPGVMATLIAHWDSHVKRTFREPKRESSGTRQRTKGNKGK